MFTRITLEREPVTMGKRIFILLALIMVLSCFGCASTQRRSSEALPPEATVLPGQVPVESSAESLPEETLQETGKPTEPVQSTEAAEPTQETEASEDGPYLPHRN